MTTSPKSDAVLRIKEESGGTWLVTVNGRAEGRASTRDMAIYWAGWWVGRRQLGKAVAAHVKEGGKFEAECLESAESRT